MTFFQIPYSIIIKPLQLFFEYIYSVALRGIGHPGLSIVALSLAMNLLVLPLYKRADEVQEAERDMENKLRDGVNHIKKTFKGDEKMMMLSTYYRQNGYRPTDVIKSSISLFLEIPFFIAAYKFLSTLSILNGVSFGPISDLGAPDALITIGAFSINLLPIIMTTVNLISCIIFTKGYPLKTKIQLYGMAIFFFFFLYKSPSGLVFYWTLNNIFSLGKTIYYKAEKQRFFINILFAVIGVLALITAPVAYVKITGSKSFILLVALFAFVCMLPLIISLLKKKKVVLFKNTDKDEKPSLVLFIAACLYLALFIGLLIPSGVVQSSPQEFVDVYHYMNPLWFVVSSTCIAIGLFNGWFLVFYGLMNNAAKKVFTIAVIAADFIATVDFMFFARKAGNLDKTLKYTDVFAFGKKEMLINLVIITAIIAVVIVLFKYVKSKISIFIFAAVFAITVMSGINFVKTNKEVAKLLPTVERIKQGEPSFTLSREGKNVIVLMLDRAMGEYMPYFLNEKPELAEMYDGFTYYSNTVSFGGFTNFGTPPLFGGYEYTPEEMNKRDTELLEEKQNEALKVMPVIFDENGYNVTVCDPPYAGYQWVPDLSIYDEYPEIQTYITKGYFWNIQKAEISTSNYRNFFCYALMKSSPVVLQLHLYNDGFYNETLSDENKKFEGEMQEASGQVNSPDFLTAEGINDPTMEDYMTLINLPHMTNIVDDDSYNFMMMDNELTHTPSLFQEPNYDLAYYLDNTEYENAHRDRYTVNGVTLTMESGPQYITYQTNMAALLRVGEWLDYLKEQGVYDNTRIIIVADHGASRNHNSKFYIDGSDDPLMNTEYFYPLLMIKDFDSHGFSESDEFMTNADVPTYAFDGLVENPVNPFTGKEINNDAKYNQPLHILSSDKYDPVSYHGYTFEPGLWLTVEKDMRDINNWHVLRDDR